MAATWIRAIHVNKDKTIAQTLAERTGYVENPDKTEDGLLVTGYACEPRSADEEFLLAKREYEHITGRKQGVRNVLAYHIRQSFKPGEIDSETANQIGHRLVLSFTKGKHAYIVATHVDKKHIHNHIVFNSTNLACDGKFNIPKRPDRIIRRISDLLCAEHGLSVIEQSASSKSNKYNDWLGQRDAAPNARCAETKENGQPLSFSEKLRRKIDEVLPLCASFEDFIVAMKNAGYTVNQKRKHITFLVPGQKKPTRLDTLKGDYTEAAIRRRVAADKLRTTGTGDSSSGTLRTPPKTQPKKVSLLIDIQAKLLEGKGEGYEHWATIFNLQQAAKTLLFLRDNGIDSYDDLAQKSASASAEFTALTDKIKAADNRLSEIAELQKQIGIYSKTRQIYAQYKASGWDKAFYEQFRADITLHRTAKKHFDACAPCGKTARGQKSLKKLPTIQSLKQEYATVLAEKKKLYAGYHDIKQKRTELGTAKRNVDTILGIKPNLPNQGISHDPIKGNSPKR